MARRKKLENTSLEEQLEYVEQEIRTKESDLKELRHKAKEIQKEIEEKQKDELFKALVASGKTIDEVMRHYTGNNISGSFQDYQPKNK